jgi:Putative prokaryotic signal transducing protein
MFEERDSIVVARFNHRYEADIAAGYLDNAGIDSVVSADDAGGADLGLAFTRRVRLIVLLEDELRATRVLEDAGVLEDEEQEDG